MEIINNTQLKFLKDFNETYKYITNKSLDSILNKKLGELFHINFYGPEGSFKNFYVYYLIKHITGNNLLNSKNIIEKINVNNNIVEFEVLLNENFIEINPSQNNFYDRWIITEYIQNLIKIKNITQSKHIIVLKDLDKLSNNSFMTLRRILEKYSNNALFIFTSTNIAHINEAINSRCFQIRCPLESDKNLKLFLSKYLNEKDKVKDIINNSERDINRIMLLYSKIDKSDFSYIPILNNEIKEHFMFLKKTKDVIKVAKENRDFLNKILNFSYNNEEIIKCFQDIILKTYKKKREILINIITILKELDMELINSQKDFFAYEKFLIKLYKFIHFSP